MPRSSRRRWFAAVAALSVAAWLVPAAGRASSPATSALPPASKLSPSMRQLVAEGGYPPADAALLAKAVTGYQAGDVYYLADADVPVDDALVGALRGTGARVRFTFPLIRSVALVSTIDAVARVAALQHVTHVQLDGVQEVLSTSARVSAATALQVADQSKRGTHDTGADVLWAQGIAGSGVTVGVADSGIDANHPDLDDQDWQTWSAPTHTPKITGFVDCSTTVPVVGGGSCTAVRGYDDNGHGSHVSGIIAGSAEGDALPDGAPDHGNGALPGMAPAASLAGAKVCTAAGVCLNSSVMAGMQYHATPPPAGAGAQVINMSLGGDRGYGALLFGANEETNADDESKLVNTLSDTYNVLFSIAAGNSGPYIGSTTSPSVAAQSMSVGASIADYDRDASVADTLHGEFGNICPSGANTPAGIVPRDPNASCIATFSSRGPSGDRLVKPDLTAPGVYVVSAESSTGGEVKATDASHDNHFSTDPFYAVESGTSMAAPSAAGAAALVIDGYRQSNNGASPAYYRLKAALANTARPGEWEGAVAGIVGALRVKASGQTPDEYYGVRDQAVGVTGEGAGRVYAPDALFALTKGVVAYTPGTDVADIHVRQPSWAVTNDLAPGQSASQAFVLHGAPRLAQGVSIDFAVQLEREPQGVNRPGATWFTLPAAVTATRNADVPVTFGVAVPTWAKPGLYDATIVANVHLPHRVQKLRIPVQFYVDLKSPSIEGPIWASDTTDYTLVGAENPLSGISTDWIHYPVRVTGAPETFSVYDTAGADHMDVFVFDSNGNEVDSTVSFDTLHGIPTGDALQPTTKDSPATVTIFDGNDLVPVTDGVVWVAISDTKPANPKHFATYHLDVTTASSGGGGGGTTPPDRIHSPTHAYWGGSLASADDLLTRTISVPAGGASLKFWTWYELEDGYDWAYALVSTDGGATWTSLATTSPSGVGTTTLDPIGDSGGTLGGSKKYPNGFTGNSGTPPAYAGENAFAGPSPTLVQQVADLTPYAGHTVTLAFGYTSDSGTNLSGFYVDDVEVDDAIGHAALFDDMETAGTWTSSGTPGFQRVQATTS